MKNFEELLSKLHTAKAECESASEALDDAILNYEEMGEEAYLKDAARYDAIFDEAAEKRRHLKWQLASIENSIEYITKLKEELEFLTDEGVL